MVNVRVRGFELTLSHHTENPHGRGLSIFLHLFSLRQYFLHTVFLWDIFVGFGLFHFFKCTTETKCLSRSPTGY